MQPGSLSAPHGPTSLLCFDTRPNLWSLCHGFSCLSAAKTWPPWPPSFVRDIRRGAHFLDHTKTMNSQRHHHHHPLCLPDSLVESISAIGIPPACSYTSSLPSLLLAQSERGAGPSRHTGEQDIDQGSGPSETPQCQADLSNSHQVR